MSSNSFHKNFLPYHRWYPDTGIKNGMANDH